MECPDRQIVRTVSRPKASKVRGYVWLAGPVEKARRKPVVLSQGKRLLVSESTETPLHPVLERNVNPRSVKSLKKLLQHPLLPA